MTKLTYEPRVGMRVVCLRGPDKGMRGVASNNIERHTGLDARYPRPGKTYTIRHVNELASKTILLFDEVHNSHLVEFVRQDLEPGFGADHFEPAP